MTIDTRPNANIILSDNPFADVVDNIVKILKRDLRDEYDSNSNLKYIRRLTDVLDDDVILIPKPPCITVSFMDWEEEITTIGQTNQSFVYKIMLDIYYYHCEAKNTIRDKEIRDALWEISRVLRRNSDLYGLSSMGALIKGGSVIYKKRNNALYQGGLIRLQVPLKGKERRGTTGA